MGRDKKTVAEEHLFPDIIYGKAAGVAQVLLDFPKNLLILVHVDLIAEDFGLVLNIRHIFIDKFGEFKCCLHIFEQAHKVCFLVGGNLHAVEAPESLLGAVCLECRAVQGCVVVGEGHQVKPFLLCLFRNGGR